MIYHNECRRMWGHKLSFFEEMIRKWIRIKNCFANTWRIYFCKYNKNIEISRYIGWIYYPNSNRKNHIHLKRNITKKGIWRIMQNSKNASISFFVWKKGNGIAICLCQHTIMIWTNMYYLFVFCKNGHVLHCLQGCLSWYTDNYFQWYLFFLCIS